MKAITLSILAALFAGTSLAEQITGQVFIVTNGHQTIKLALVPIVAFDKEAVVKASQECSKQWLLEANAFINTTQKPIMDLDYQLTMNRRLASKALRDQCGRLSSEAIRYLDYLMSSQRLFEHLPPALAATKSDADGNFSIDVPDRTCVVIGAVTMRTVFDKVEPYHWLVPASETDGKLMLSNDNLTSAYPTGSPYHWTEVQLPYPESADAIAVKFKRLQLEIATK